MSVLPFASTGTGVSSPCRRCAASTCAAMSSCSGRSANAHAPTWSASVEKAELHTLSGVALALAVQRLMLPVLLIHDGGELVRTRPAPCGTAWNGAGAWESFSQSRQVNFSRTVWITFQRRGITSSVSVTSSPTFDRCFDPQHVHEVGEGHHHALARQMLGEGLARGPAALQPLDLGARLRSPSRPRGRLPRPLQ